MSGSAWRGRARRALRLGVAGARALPAPAKQALRTAARALPEDSAAVRRLRRAARAQPSGGTARRPKKVGGYGGYLHWTDAGETYSEREVSTFQQLELAYLKRELFQTPLPATPVPETAGEDALSAPGRVAEYLALTAPGEGPLHLVLVNEYPRTGAEYGNGFVHRRVKYYLDAGVRVHVAVVGSAMEPGAEVYDGVPVLRGRGAEAAELLRTQPYASVSCHFLNKEIWDQVAEAMEGHRLFAFMHGFESRRWVRTIRNYRSPEPLSNGIKDSLIRQRFWREVLAHPHGPERFLFVSRWWRQGAQDDLELVFPGQRTSVVHNVIDTDLFRYVEKDPEQRFRILWIRSAANLNYAPDLAVAALSRLRETPWWDRVTVRIIGDGKHFSLFEETFASDANVTVERRFASQEEIAQLHRDYGLFLVPTRWDSQGVSRDEAMASGLVAVTNAACAVPEFVDESCCLLAPAEDVEAMVRSMVQVFKDPDLFTRLSRAGRARVEATTAPEHTVHREMHIMGLVGPGREDRTP
ncbi:glycosyltransferase family 4 protein [uncultured Micrococcus sp.]|uniref:glycosyltransferase family 4 protein n=1 Tax=uncultured Micrococcus sp. TaxID=114051 RepID=UPI00260C1B05|nr:glycosyltransferase family 4 protein [uncultured Micrococcus sp.]